MAKTEPFNKHYQQYDHWFTRNRNVFLSELNAVRQFIPKQGDGLEVGVGTGQFAKLLGIQTGLEPSAPMRKIAEQKGIHVLEGVAEAMPFDDRSFDYVVMITTICFLQDPNKAFQEIYRVLRENGKLITGFVDVASPLGQLYLKNKEQNVFYKDATFYSVQDVLLLLDQSKFSDIEIIQTVFGDFRKIKHPQGFESGHGDGGFAVIKAVKAK